ncbi:MAG: hypothetical protein QM817_37695 [Archangium sp.]
MSDGWVAPPEPKPRATARWLAHGSWVLMVAAYGLLAATKGHKAPMLFLTYAVMTVSAFIAAVVALLTRKGQPGVLAPAIVGLVLSACQALGILLLLLGIAGLGMAG